MTGPELSVLLAYAKITLDADLLESDLPEDAYLRSDLVDALPASLRARFQPRMRQHRLRREIVTTDLANSIVDYAGTTFVSRLAEETGADTAHIARAYAVAVAVFEMRGFWREVQALDDVVDEETQFKMLLQGRRLVTRAARWLVRNRRPPLDIGAAVSDYSSRGGHAVGGAAGTAERGRRRRMARARGGIRQCRRSKRARIARCRPGCLVLRLRHRRDRPWKRRARPPRGRHPLRADHRLELAWLRDRILELPRADRWQTLARAALRDDLYKAHRALTAAALKASSTSIDGDAAIDAWVQASAATVERYLATLGDIRAAHRNDFTTLFVAVRKLANLTPPSSN